MLVAKTPAVVKPNLTRSEALTRITALTRQLYKDIEYASHAYCRGLWNAYQKRRSAASIAKKKAECRRVIQAVGAQELLAITEKLWEALWHEWPLDRPDPAPPILARQKAIIAKLRAPRAPA